MGLETPTAVVFQIRYPHRNEEVRELGPSPFRGTLNTDGGSSYNARELEFLKQQQCLSHILRLLKEALEDKEGEQRWFCETLKRYLQQAIDLGKEYHQGNPAHDEIRAREIEAKVTEHLRDRQMTDPDDQRLLNTRGGYHDRGHLLRFLQDPKIEPTNNRAARMLRPAVIARKGSQCSKNQRGADAHAAFLSVIGTLYKRGMGSLIDALANVMATGQRPLPAA